MRWFRSNAGRDAWLALFALACQFVFAFGHVHLARVSASDTLTITAGAPAGPAGGPRLPGRGVPSGLTQDFCALCSNINLASTLVLPVPPAVLPPTAFDERLQRSPATVSSTPRDHHYFEARGPPPA
jgi:hypothetical protein